MELSSDVYDRIYSGGAPEIPEVVRRILRDLVRTFEPYRKNNRLCDLGFGAGTLLEVAAELGWECHGTETSEVALRAGRTRGWKVSRPADSAAATARGEFDVVTAIEFLEHLSDPRSEIERAASTLRPGGLLYLTTPNARSLNRRLLGPAWSVIAPPEHRLLWSRAGLCASLRAAGMIPTQVRTTGLNPTDLLSRARTAAQRGPPSRVETAYQINTWASQSSLRRGLKGIVNQTLNLCELGDTLKVWAIRPEEEA